MEAFINSTMLKEIFEIIRMSTQNSNKKPYIVGINGLDTSGKTSFSKTLFNYFRSIGQKAVLIHLDDFHNQSSIRKKGNNEINAYIKNAFNLRLLEDKLLKPLKSDGRINVKLDLLDLNTDTYTNTKSFHADEDTIIILEGILLYREPLNKYFDYRVFLDITFKMVLKRAEKRDVQLYGEDFLNKYKTKYIPIQKWYIENYKPKENCNLLIDNNDYNNPFVIANR